MNDTENKIHQTFIRIRDFGRDHANDFAANSVGKQAFTTLDGIINELDGHAASEASGFGRERHGTSSRSEAREDLRDLVKAISRTAEVLADVPGVAHKFALPASDGDRALINSARGFATDLAPFVAQFEAHEMPDLLANLNGKIAAMEAAIDVQAGGIGDHVASRAAIDEAIERGLQVRRTLDAIVRNKYEDDAVVLAEWTSARHIEGRMRKRVPSTPPPAPSITPAS